MLHWFNYNLQNEEEIIASDSFVSQKEEEETTPVVVKCLIVIDNETRVPMDVPKNEVRDIFQVLEFVRNAIKNPTEEEEDTPISVKLIGKSNCYWYNTKNVEQGVVTGFNKNTNSVESFNHLEEINLPKNSTTIRMPRIQKRRRK